MRSLCASKYAKSVVKALVAVGLSSVLVGCGIEQANNATKGSEPKEAKKVVETHHKHHEHMQTSAEHITPLNFNYPVHIAQSQPWNRSVAILAPNIQVSDNLKPYIDKFQDALANQIQSIFEKRGYKVLRFKDKDALSVEEKKEVFSVLDLRGWVGVLEDLKMNLNDPTKPNLDTLVDQSSGSVWFNFYEPETGRVIHDFGVEVGTFRAITHTFSYAYTDYGATNRVEHASLEKNKEDAIHKILNRIYVEVMKRAVAELTEENISRYRDAIDKIKKSLHTSKVGESQK
ncbi:HpaA family protein [Helicobacter cetorum]|uniref:HpaA family protein n=1 Tax=Helicobacter cetorum TaxID=138563 RepID=UPI000CF140E7|nr:HpaA family protein [Helicobacter cetorum]